MHLVLRVLCISMLTLCCLSSTGEIGCKQWTTSAGSPDVCCERCNPGNRLMTRCGPDPEKLCVPCRNETYTTDGTSQSCLRCTQCGAQFLKAACTKSKDTECDCRAGFRCGDDHCSFCVEECGTGQEPLPIRTHGKLSPRSCRNCPEGTFNDKIHEKCKSWRTRLDLTPPPCKLLMPHLGSLSSLSSCFWSSSSPKRSQRRQPPRSQPLMS
uniref:Tumor necrosis factor receptor superfamily, member 9a n=1 Tax=Oncorhynchus kisutch TaxID=8019 RepID=A0A8C7KHJ7_ONCKI